MGEELSDTFRDLEQFERQVDQVLQGVFPQRFRSRLHVWRPPTDVYETDEAVIVKVEIAGMNPEEIHISFVERVLTVRGIRRDLDAKQSYHCMEIPYGEFVTEVVLPGTFDEEAFEARYEDGFLRITLPKSRSERRVPIRIQSGEKDEDREPGESHA